MKQFKVAFPTWFKVMFTICYIWLLKLPVGYILQIVKRNLFYERLFEISFIVGLCLLITWFIFRFIYCSIEVTDRKLTLKYFGITKRQILWNEIIEIKRPRFNFPYDFSMLLLKSNQNIYLIRSMKNFKKLETFLMTGRKNE